MTKLISTAAAAGIAIALAASAAAQPGPRGPGPGTMGGGMMGPGMMGERGFGFMCSPRAAGMAEWRMERIEAAVKPTDAQRAALDELKAASAKAAELMSGACTTAIPDKAGDRLAAMEKRLDAMQQALKLVRPAFEKFYAGLDADQKVKLDAAGPRGWGWRNWRPGWWKS
jgi:LTXXQ motif family protein